MLFQDLPGLAPDLVARLAHAEFTEATPIQAQCIPVGLQAKNLVCEAATGSGKTLCFVIPMLQLLEQEHWTRELGLTGLIISPTRELAHQTFAVFKRIQTNLTCGTVVGGKPLELEAKMIGDLSVITATPGRLLQHFDENRNVQVDYLRILVLDEADKLLELGFAEVLDSILDHLRITQNSRQTLLFSATVRNSLLELGHKYFKQPKKVRYITPMGVTRLAQMGQQVKFELPEELTQTYATCDLGQKVDYLFYFLREFAQKKLMVFVSTCKQVRFFFETFKRLQVGPPFYELHGRQSLEKRMKTLEYFKKQKVGILVCTDVACRGIDIPKVGWVIQMDAPADVDSYIHRIGRTARNKQAGKALILLTPQEQDRFLAAAANHELELTPLRCRMRGAIQGRLTYLLNQHATIEHLAHKALITYFKSLKTSKFLEDSPNLDVQGYGYSLGLETLPDLDFLKTPPKAEPNKLKNFSKLEKLKEKIKAKKAAKLAANP